MRKHGAFDHIHFLRHLPRHFSCLLGGAEGHTLLPGHFGVEERGIDWEVVPVEWFLVSFPGSVPVDDSLLLVAEACDLFFMFDADERLVIVADGGSGPRDIVCVE